MTEFFTLLARFLHAVWRSWKDSSVQESRDRHRYKPAWNDRNVREVASYGESQLFVSHIRASTGTLAQQTNRHPFRYCRWFWAEM